MTLVCGPGLVGGPAAGRPAAVLWDMDGLLVDSEPGWTIAERELFTDWGSEFTSAIKAQIMGTRLDVSVPLMIAAAGATADPVAVTDWLLARMAQLYAEELPLRPGAADLLAALACAGVPQALVSSSFRVLVDAVLAGIPGHPFAVSVAGDEVARGKPDPQPYLVAAARLGVDPAACVVLEDSVSGAAAGAAAGCRVFVVPSAGPIGPDPRWTVVATLTGLGPVLLAADPNCRRVTG